MVVCLAVAPCLVTAGCGGGGGGTSSNSGSTGNNTPPVNTSTSYTSAISGSVTDGNGGAIVGATVTFPGHPSVTTTQFGLYQIPSVVIPIGQVSVINKITATATVNGAAWSGQNTVSINRGVALTDNVQISASLTSTQGAITGTVTDSKTKLPIANARVYIADGPYTGGTVPSTYQYFSIASSYTAYTNSTGVYTIGGLTPLSNYTVTASVQGYQNQTLSNLNVATAATTSGVNLALQAISTSATIPVVTGLSASAITTPMVPTRAAADLQQIQGVTAIKLNLLQKLGYLKYAATDLTKATIKSSVTRSAPAGYTIESIVIWNYTQVNNLFGFDILRSTTTLNQFGSLALLYDPLGDRFADDDPTLTPDTTYYYSVAGFDTLNYPKNGSEGAAATPPAAVEPLEALSLVSPASGATLTTTPVFTWSAVARANTYTIMLYSQFPNYQNDLDPNAIQPIWSIGTSATTQTYTSTPLTHGQTYYWAVLAQDSAVTDFSISPIQSFVAP